MCMDEPLQDPPAAPAGAPACGRAAPPFAVSVGGLDAITLASFTGQPLVLAFLTGWDPTCAADEALGGARAELRGLGAVLLVAAEDALWCFRPDDELELFASVDTGSGPDLLALRTRYGVHPGTPSALFVIDDAGIVRFVHAPSVGADRDPTFASVVQALELAGRALCARDGLGDPQVASRDDHRSDADGGPTAPVGRSGWQPSRREIVVGSLVTAAWLVLGRDGAPASAAGAGVTSTSPPDDRAAGVPPEVEITWRVNDHTHTLRVDARASVLDVLRERLALTAPRTAAIMGSAALAPSSSTDSASLRVSPWR